MAKRKRTNDDQFPTLGKNIPHVLGYLILAALFLASVRIVQIALGNY